jgi:uncharacterized membrane protein YphA (DoxX/SURF4 family)
VGQNNGTPGWSAVGRILFRFAFAYLLLYNVFGGNFQPLWAWLWNPIVSAAGKYVFGVTVPPPQVTNSGDRTYDYVQAFCFLVLAIAAAGVWSLVDRKRREYGRLNEALRVFVRAALALWMVVYGIAKINQFPSPPLDVLQRPVGETSPMMLLWTFMGHSVAYTLFTGVAEVLGGLLLLSRRTTTLGAIVCAGVMSNVVMLNFCYDVPVKLFSSHLLLMAVWLLLPDLKRLANVFLLNRAGAPVEYPPLFAKAWATRLVLIAPAVLVLGIAYLNLLANFQVRQYFTQAANQPMRGIWEVEEFEADGEVRPPLLTDELRWRRVIVSRPGIVSVQQMSDARINYLGTIDAEAQKLALSNPQKPDWQSSFNYRETEPGRVELEGTYDGKKVRAKLRRADESEFLLVKRGFHWVNEYPFNY